MFRYANTTVAGHSFRSELVEFVWSKATTIAGYDSNVYRKDRCGAWMKRSDYGNTNSNYGWEIDHIDPVANGGTDSLLNLQPLHWKNNRGKGDNYPSWYCSISARQ